MSKPNNGVSVIGRRRLTVGYRLRSRDICKGSGDIIKAVRDTIDADAGLLETDPEEVLVSKRV